MEVHLYSVKAKSKTGNMWVKHTIQWQHKKAKAKRKSARDLKNLHILSENSTDGLRSRRERCWGYISAHENTPEKLPQLCFVVQGRA